MPLILDPNFHDPDHATPYAYMAGDAFYAELLQAHDGLTEEQSARLDARLVLLLANHIGNLRVLRAALHAAGAAETPESRGARSADTHRQPSPPGL